MAEPTVPSPGGRRIDDFDVVAFDADDTLWRSEDSFESAERRFVELVAPYAPDGVDVYAALRATEKADVPVTGYGVKAFTLSMIRAAITVTNETIPSAVIGELGEIGRSMLTEPVQLLDHVPEVLTEVAAVCRVVLITKGDLVHQTRKITTSGIEHHFAELEIVLEKDAEVYTKLLQRFGVAAQRFCMVGNSVRSDILPVLAIGGHAVHIPYHLTWELERVDDHDEDVVELDLDRRPPRLARPPLTCRSFRTRPRMTRCSDHRRRRRTRSTWWSPVLCTISDARSRVGAMFSRRLSPLMLCQMSAGGVDRLVVVELGIHRRKNEVGVLEHRRPQREEPIDVPLLDVVPPRRRGRWRSRSSR